MKVFFRTAIYFIFPVIVCSGSIEYLFRNIPNEYSYKNGYLLQYSNSIENLFLGSSHALYGIKPEYIDGRSFNAAHVSQTLNFDLAILKKYQSNWQSLKIIAIPIDYFSFFETLEVGTENWRVKNYHLYYDITQYSSFRNRLELLSPHIKISLRRAISHYMLKKTINTCDELGWATDYHSRNSQDLTLTGASAAERHTAKNQNQLHQNLSYLNEICRFASQNKTIVILYSSPAYSSYTEKLNQDQLNKTITYVSQVANSYDNTFYFDLMSDQRFIAEDFYDADHLNEKGAKKLSQIMNNIINSLRHDSN